MRHYHRTRTPALLGDDVPEKSSSSFPSLYGVVSSPAVKTASAILLTYHGYRRTGSILWALLYGLAGRTVPVVAVPIAAAQGLGKRKTCQVEP
jgi:hypothetical protein